MTGDQALFEPTDDASATRWSTISRAKSTSSGSDGRASTWRREHRRLVITSAAVGHWFTASWSRTPGTIRCNPARPGTS